MVAGDVNVLAPRELILPIARYAPAASLPEGLIFVSAGALCYVSGATIVRMWIAATNISGGVLA